MKNSSSGDGYRAELLAFACWYTGFEAQNKSPRVSSRGSSTDSRHHIRVVLLYLTNCYDTIKTSTILCSQGPKCLIFVMLQSKFKKHKGYRKRNGDDKSEKSI